MKVARGHRDRIFIYQQTSRPWGYFDLFSDNTNCTVKVLCVKPGESLSLQVHKHRDQAYIVLDHGFEVQYSQEAVPQIILDDEDLTIEYLNKHLIHIHPQEGDMFAFKRGVAHRLGYHGSRAYGRCLDLAFGVNDEKDIIRLEDRYNRNKLNGSNVSHTLIESTLDIYDDLST